MENSRSVSGYPYSMPNTKRYFGKIWGKYSRICQSQSDRERTCPLPSIRYAHWGTGFSTMKISAGASSSLKNCIHSSFKSSTGWIQKSQFGWNALTVSTRWYAKSDISGTAVPVCSYAGNKHIIHHLLSCVYFVPHLYHNTLFLLIINRFYIPHWKESTPKHLLHTPYKRV